MLDAPVLQWHASKVRALAGARGRREIVAIAFDPVFLPHVEALRPLHCVYMQYEALAHLPQVRYGFHELERRLVARADMVISLTKPMAQVLPGSGAVRARLLPSAVRFDEFRQAEARPCPPDLAAIARPRIGYVGSITVALDFELILEVARSRPHWQLVFIGPVARDGGTESVGDSACDAKWRAVRALPNVHYLAQKPAGEVPAYMAHMDVNALWYRTAGEGWWLRGSPIKLYENLAVGKPVVGARLAAIQDFEGIVDIADTPQQWLCAIDRALESGSPVDVARRISVARENSWDKRVDVLESWIVEMVAARANTGRRCVIDAETLAAMKREAGRP
ncbi:MAG: glycosyltransferase [Burkholderiales bacterium]|nr:glycosyltransferase [Burkholderiales bacterium]